MRILVMATATAGLRPIDAGAVVGAAWADLGHQVAVVPAAEGGDALIQAAEDLRAGVVGVRDPDELRRAVDGDATTVLVDLTTPRDDLGRGYVDALGGSLARARERIAGLDLVGIVHPDDLLAPLLGVQGVASQAGYAAGLDVSDVLAADEANQAVATEWGLASPPAGAGAGGGAALGILALGGRLASGPEAFAELVGLPATVFRADLVVTVCPALDFGGHGVVLVTAASTWASQVTTPCVAIAEQVRVSARELRTYGVESAYPFHDGETGPQALDAVARAVARTWTW